VSCCWRARAERRRWHAYLECFELKFECGVRSGVRLGLVAGNGTADRDYRDWVLLFLAAVIALPSMLSGQCPKALFELSSQSDHSVRVIALVLVLKQYQMGVVVVLLDPILNKLGFLLTLL
jgi:hypothetical protein